MFNRLKETILKYKIEIIIYSCYFLYLLFIRIITPLQDWPNIENGDTDPTYYYKMSKDITSIFKGEIIQPFCYRPLVPFLTSLLPFDLIINYSIIHFISFYLIGILLYHTLRLRFNKSHSAVGIFILCYINTLNGTYAFMRLFFYHAFMIDSLVFLFLILCFYCILSSNNKLYAIFLCIGILAKEVVLFTIPVFLVYNVIEVNKLNTLKELSNKRFLISLVRKKFIVNKLKLILKYSIFIIPAIIVFIIFRIVPTPAPLSDSPFFYRYYQGYDYMSIEWIKVQINRRINEIKYGYDFIFYTIGIWGIIPSILLIFNKQEEFIRWFKLYSIFMVLIYAQLIFGYSGYRLMYAGIFPIIFLGISGLQNPKSKWAIPILLIYFTLFSQIIQLRNILV